MPSDCLPANSGNYAVRHNPPLYYTKLAGCAHNRLPAFSFITPNLIHDMHNGTVADGDSWLAKNLPAILRRRAYQSRSTVVFLAWDEGESGSSNRCATNTTDIGCHTATIVISPSTRKGTRSRTRSATAACSAPPSNCCICPSWDGHRRSDMTKASTSS